jgi:hypothetical protein
MLIEGLLILAHVHRSRTPYQDLAALGFQAGGDLGQDRKFGIRTGDQESYVFPLAVFPEESSIG